MPRERGKGVRVEIGDTSCRQACVISTEDPERLTKPARSGAMKAWLKNRCGLGCEAAGKASSFEDNFLWRAISSISIARRRACASSLTETRTKRLANTILKETGGCSLEGSERSDSRTRSFLKALSGLSSRSSRRVSRRSRQGSAEIGGRGRTLSHKKVRHSCSDLTADRPKACPKPIARGHSCLDPHPPAPLPHSGRGGERSTAGQLDRSAESVRWTPLSHAKGEG